MVAGDRPLLRGPRSRARATPTPIAAVAVDRAVHVGRRDRRARCAARAGRDVDGHPRRRRCIRCATTHDAFGAVDRAARAAAAARTTISRTSPCCARAHPEIEGARRRVRRAGRRTDRAALGTDRRDRDHRRSRCMCTDNRVWSRVAYDPELVARAGVDAALLPPIVPRATNRSVPSPPPRPRISASPPTRW